MAAVSLGRRKPLDGRIAGATRDKSWAFQGPAACEKVVFMCWYHGMKGKVVDRASQLSQQRIRRDQCLGVQERSDSNWNSDLLDGDR